METYYDYEKNNDNTTFKILKAWYVMNENNKCILINLHILQCPTLSKNSSEEGWNSNNNNRKRLREKFLL